MVTWSLYLMFLCYMTSTYCTTNTSKTCFRNSTDHLNETKNKQLSHCRSLDTNPRSSYDVFYLLTTPRCLFSQLFSSPHMREVTEEVRTTLVAWVASHCVLYSCVICLCGLIIKNLVHFYKGSTLQIMTPLRSLPMG